MIFFTIFFKNLKILFRSWGSALIVLIAPLLIVLIIGASLSSSETTKLNIGFSGNSTGELSQRILDSLNSSDNDLIYFPEIFSCKRAIELGVVSACVNIPQNLSLDHNARNVLDFYVDESRMNLVYEVINSIQTDVQSESKEITEEIGSKLISILQMSQQMVDESISQLNELEEKQQQNKQLQQELEKELSSFNLPTIDIDVSDMKYDVEKLNDYLYSVRHASKDVIDSAEEVLSDMNESEFDELKSDISKLEEEWKNSISYFVYVSSLNEGINSTQIKIDSIGNRIEGLEEDKAKLQIIARDIKSGLDEQEPVLSTLDENLYKISGEIASFELTNPELIASPVETNIKPVNADRRKLVYTFPYLLMLIVLFVGMMLPSTMMLMEKKSKAFFRNFVTPVRLSFFSFMIYVTSIILISIQMFIVFLVAYFCFDIPLIANIGSTLLILFLSITVFSLLGLFLGNLLNTFEGITMISIALGSVFLFLSNLVLSLENLSPVVQKIAHFNPYVIGSESLRRSLLFGDSISSIFPSLCPLLFYIAGLMILVVLSLMLLKSRYFYLAKN
ncbi:MAG: type transport system permease protein [Candidatus Woesearchaeota archaeon]|nr:type transport system permease protein [Candidatus Woesearchaeota archaeon]